MLKEASTIAKNIKKYRAKLGISQDKLSKLAGITLHTITKIESGATPDPRIEKEHFAIFYLDSRNQEIKREIISVGSLNANLGHPREVFEPAVRNLSAQIILAHNHPSGDPEPSEDDLKITKRLVESGKILGIEVVDLKIITKTNFVSLKKKNLI